MLTRGKRIASTLGKRSFSCNYEKPMVFGPLASSLFSAFWVINVITRNEETLYKRQEVIIESQKEILSELKKRK
jgi:hypothetical protein